MPTMNRKDSEIIAGYIKGNAREYFIINQWITAVVENKYWGLQQQWADIIQEVRMKLFVNFKREQFRFSSSLKTYVYRVTKYTCIDYLRKKNRTDEVSIEKVEIKSQEDSFESLIRIEQKEILRQIFLKLKERCRQILKMVFLQNRSYKEVCLALNVAEGTVKSRVSRCIQDAIELRKDFIK